MVKYTNVQPADVAPSLQQQVHFQALKMLSIDACKFFSAYHPLPTLLNFALIILIFAPR